MFGLGLGLMGINVFGPGSGGDVTPIGTIYNKQTWADLSDFTVTGTTFSISSGAIRMAPSGTGSFDRNIELNLPIISDEKFDLTVKFTCVSLGANAQGTALGRQSQNTATTPIQSISLQYNTNAIPNSHGWWPKDADSAATFITSFNIALGGDVDVGDVFIVEISQNVNVFTGKSTNVTKGNVVNTFSITADLTLTPLFLMPNTSKYRITALGGTFDITSIVLSSSQYVNPTISCIGDSKTVGAVAGTVAQRWATLMASAGSINVWAGGGDRTVEFITEIPLIVNSTTLRTVVLNIARNDVAFSVPTALWQANYKSIVSKLKAMGVNFIHLLPIPERVGSGFALDQSAITTFINANFAADQKVDVTSVWDVTNDVSSDNIHPTASGHAKIANAILSSGFLSTAPSSGAAASFLARTSGLDAAHIAAYTAFINGLISDKVFVYADAIYLTATDTSTNGLLNLVSADFPLTVNGSPTFTANSGYVGAVSAWLSTGFNQSTMGTQNSDSVFFWTLDSFTGAVASGGVYGEETLSATPKNGIFPHFTDNNYYANINDNVTTALASVTNAHFYGVTRGSAATRTYWQGTTPTVQTAASSAPNNSAMMFLSDMSALARRPFLKNLAFGWKGRYVNPDQVALIYARVHTYMQTIAGAA